MTEKLERTLPTVQKPARYVGGEYGQTMKDKRSVELRVAFCFPDTYEIGMSNLGMRILYAVMNRMEGVWCERVFAPWGDMEDAMRANGLPLYALESGDPVSELSLIHILRRFLDELEDAVGAGKRILQLRYHAGNFVEGLRILVGIAEETCQLADGDAALHGAERARHADARIDERVDKARGRDVYKRQSSA